MTSPKEEYIRSLVNLKYRRMQGEFVYRGVPWVSWTSLERIQTIESEAFEWRHDDVLLATYPKSGTTLLEEMVWLLMNRADFETAKSLRVFARVPFLEENYQTVYPGQSAPLYPLDYVSTMSRNQRRILKTHLPYRHLGHAVDHTPGLKTLVCLRNPKDTMVSDYHFYRGTEDYGPFKGSFSEYFQMWMDGWIAGGDWLDVVQEWCQVRKRNTNVHFMFYEDLVRKPLASLRQLIQFLQLEESPHFIQEVEPRLEDIVRHCSFDSMKANPMTNFTDTELGFTKDFQFMRKGVVGDWKNWFTVAQNEIFDDKYLPILRDLGLDKELQFE